MEISIGLVDAKTLKTFLLHGFGSFEGGSYVILVNLIRAHLFFTTIIRLSVIHLINCFDIL